MANDRISIRCDRCGTEKVLFKYGPNDNCWEGWETEGLQVWIRSHVFGDEPGCDGHPRAWHETLGHNPGFRLVTEAGHTGQ